MDKSSGRNPLKRRDMGVAGLVVVLSQLLTTYQSTSSVSDEIRQLKYKVQEIRIDQEKNFIRKDQAKNYEAKVEEMKEDIKDIKRQLKHLRPDYAAFDPNEITGCIFTEDVFNAFPRRDNNLAAFTYRGRGNEGISIPRLLRPRLEKM